MQLELTLVRTGVISADDYVEAVSRQDEERPPLGQVAIEEGLLSVRRVLELLSTQYEEPTRRFGELAVEKGYLDTPEVATLLMRQQDRQRPLIDHLVELGRLSVEQAETARSGYANGEPIEPSSVEHDAELQLA